MGVELGSVLEGKVTGITKFGAFVSLPDGKSGLVHISEIANTYVNDVNDHVKLGQVVKVRVMNVTEDGKINLSIKRAEPPAPPPERQQGVPPRRPAARGYESAAKAEQPAPESGNQDFEDRLKKFMQDADSRIADNKMYSDHRQRNRRR
ncbi:MAG: S1 RNA-binding domain-containing protein [Oscillospiraceae bacterium]|nr:S1 RNA-binding domain-containing protein [Oscillospiraceae bacterium]